MPRVAICKYCQAEFDASDFAPGEQFECSECGTIVTVQGSRKPHVRAHHSRVGASAGRNKRKQGSSQKPRKNEQKYEDYDDGYYNQAEKSSNKKVIFISVMGVLIIALSVLLIIFATKDPEKPNTTPNPSEIADNTNDSEEPTEPTMPGNNTDSTTYNDDDDEEPPVKVKTEIVRSEDYKNFIEEFGQIIKDESVDVENFVEDFDSDLKSKLSKELSAIVYNDFKANEKLANPDDYFYAGLIFSKKRGSVDSVDCFTNCLEMLDKDAKWKFTDNRLLAYFFRAIENHKLGNKREAIDDFSEAIGMFENFENALIYRGRIYFEDRNWREALNDLEKAVEINADLLKIPNIKGMIDSCKKALNIAPKPQERSPEEIQKTIDELSQKIETDKDKPHLYALYFNRGMNYTALKDYDSALQDFDRALEEAYKNPNVKKQEFLNMRRFRAISLREVGRFDDALKEVNSLLNLHPDLPILLATRGLIFMKMKEYSKALADLEYAADLDDKLAQSDQIKDAIKECRDNK